MPDPWQAVGQAPKPATTGESYGMAWRAATNRKSEARTLRRSTRGSTKIAAPTYLAEQDEQIRLGEGCTCSVRQVDSLDIESYSRFVDGASKLSLRDNHKGLFSSNSSE